MKPARVALPILLAVLCNPALSTEIDMQQVKPLETPKTIKKEKLPLYEIGAGGGVFNGPHYPGSDQRRTRALVLPYGIYRGETFKADDEGLRGDLKNAPNYRVEISFSAAFPADSEDNEARKGMPDLDWLGELGPKFTYFFLDRPGRDKFDLSLPVRVVFSTNFKRLSGEGFTFHPVLTYRRYNVLYKNLSFYIRSGAVFADEETMDYFYEVSPRFVTSERTRFDSKEGFLELHLDFLMRWRPNDRWNFFAGFQNNFYSGTTNEASPLMRQKQTYSLALGFAWSFYKSDRRAGEAYMKVKTKGQTP